MVWAYSMQKTQNSKNKCDDLVRFIRLTLLFILGVCTNVFAQINEQDSVYIERLINRSHTELIKHQYDEAIRIALSAHQKSSELAYSNGVLNSSLIIAESYKYKTDFPKALNYFLQALSEIEKTDDLNEIRFIYKKLGDLFYNWDVPKKALSYFEKVIKLNKELNQSNSISLLNSMAETYIKLNQYPEALVYYQQVLAVQKEKKSEEVISTLKKIASLYGQLNDFSSSLTYNFEMLEINKEQKDSANTASNLKAIGLLYKKLKNLPKSLEYYNAALELNKQMNNGGNYDNNIVTNLLNIGIINLSLGDYRIAERNFNEALKIKSIRGSPVEIAVIHNYLAAINFKISKYSEAKSHTLEAIRLLEPTDNKRMLAVNLKRLSDIYKEQSDYKSALESYEEYFVLNDSIIYREQLYQERKKYKQYVIETTEKESKLEIIDHELRELEIKNEQAMAEREKQDIQLQLREKELQNISLKNEQLEGEQEIQKLRFQQEQVELQNKNQEITLLEQKRDLQESEIQKNAILERERKQEIELQKRNLELKTVDLLSSKLRQRFLLGIVALFSIILLLVFIGFRANQRINTRLTYQNKEIRNQKNQIAGVNLELIEINEEKNSLIDVVAHDLKSPLNQIIGFLNIIKLSSKDQSAEQNEYISKIDSSAEGLKRMVSKILNVSAIEAKTFNLNKQEVNLNHLLEDTVDRFEPLAAKKEIKILRDFSKMMLKSSLDSSYVTEVFTNLLSNSIKYSPIGKSIRVRLIDAGNYNRVEFIDEGQGIKKEEMGKLFRKYYKLSARPTAGEDSTGLGLSIVKKYVDVMDGKVWCESEEGKGANFIVEFEKFPEV